MSEKGSAEKDEQKIPGGKLLANYCCHVMVMALEGSLRTKAKLQLEDIYDRNRNSCVKCGFTFNVNRLISCTLHGFTCQFCSPISQGCIICAIPCEYHHWENQKCKNLLNPKAKKKCNTCDLKICDDHIQFCPHCGMGMCLQGNVTGFSDVDNCWLNHSCVQGQKRAKHGIE